MSRPQDAVVKLSQGKSLDGVQKDDKNAGEKALPLGNANEDRGSWPTDELPIGWLWVSFKEAFDHVTSNDRKLKQKEYVESGPWPVVDQGQDAVGGYTDRDELTHEAQLPVLLFGDHTKCVKYIDFQFVQGADGTKVLKPTELYHSRFGYWAMKAVHIPHRGYSRHFKFLKPTQFPLPPKAEQSRIVSAIESLQERSSRARDLLSEVGPLIDQLRQSVLRSAFSGRLTADWRAKNPCRETAAELLERIRTERRQRWEATELDKYKAKNKQPPKNWQEKYKEPEPVDESALPELPDGWCWDTLESLTRFNQGIQVPINKQHRKERHDLVRFLRIVDFTKGDEEPRFISNPGKPFCVDGLDVAMVRYGTAGFVCRGLKGAIANNLFRVSPTTSVLSREYLYHFLCSPSVQALIAKESKGATMQAISFGLLTAIPVPVPPEQEQAAIVVFLDATTEFGEFQLTKIASLQSSLTQLDQSILAKAFRGELVPQDPRDEPASELLARIRAAREESDLEKKSAKKKKTPRKRKSTKVS